MTWIIFEFINLKLDFLSTHQHFSQLLDEKWEVVMNLTINVACDLKIKSLGPLLDSK